MIEAKELRIGNLLTHDARTCRVTSLIENGESNYDIETRFVKGGEVRFNSIIYVGLEPIPLTEEWLVKFGLQHKSFSFDHERLHKDINVGYNGDDFINNQISLLYKKKVWFKIHYVHSLQNLYFALTGEELTIKE
jgi:hypothetical protein